MFYNIFNFWKLYSIKNFLVIFFSFKTSDDQERSERGFFAENDVWTVEGFYSYKDINGEEIKVNYQADDEGYRLIDDSTPNRQQDFQPQISKNAILTLLG